MNERLKLLHDYVLGLNEAGVRRTTFYTLVAESLRTNKSDSVQIRRAKAFAWLINHTPQVVNPYELIAGSILGIWPLAENLPSYEELKAEAMELLENYCKKKKSDSFRLDKSRRNILMARDYYEANVTFADLQRLIQDIQKQYADAEDINSQEIARELERHFVFNYGEDKKVVSELPWIAANHLDLNYPKLVNRGLGSILKEIDLKLAGETSAEKIEFYTAVKISLEACVQFIDRYADTLAEKSNEPGIEEARAKELNEMSEICRKIASGKPETFREALQLIWIIHTIGNIERGSALSFARFDQYMVPFYKNDIEKGILTEEDAKDLIGSLWMKVNEPKMLMVQSMTLGGLTPAGEDGTNELTRLCLEVCSEMKQPYPNVSVRISRKSPEWLFDLSVKTIKLGIGHPMMMNDEVWINNLSKWGYSIEDASDYYNMGCVEILIMGRQPNWSVAANVDFPSIFELVFRNGQENMGGETGIPTGELLTLNSFDKFLEAYKTQITHMMSKGLDNARRTIAEWKDRYFDSFASAFIDSCIEKGQDVFQGGTKLEPTRAAGGFGIGTAADSLAAIKKFVYDEKKLTLQEMFELIKTNFANRESIRTMLDNNTPCFGNDIDEVDNITAEIFNTYADAVHALNNHGLPGRFATSLFSYNRHVNMGEIIAATPNGRKERTPMSDAIGPSQGKDIGGPTRLINSILKLDHGKATGAYALNIKLDTELAKGQAGSENLKALIKTYFNQGGIQLQINFINNNILKEAQENPEKHKNLIVRIAGYCEFFHNLDKNLQDEIINRTGHSV